MNAFREAHRHLLPGSQSIAASTQVAAVLTPRTDRESDLAVVVDHHGANAFTDDMVMARVFRRLRWEMLTDEALEMLAREYEAEAAMRERMAAENRALAQQAGAR